MNPSDHMLAVELAGIAMMALREYAASHPDNTINAMIYAAAQMGVSLRSLGARLAALQTAGLVDERRSTSRKAVREARRRAEIPVQEAVMDYLND